MSKLAVLRTSVMFMNFFRIAGDVCHLLSFVVMFWKLYNSQSVAGISLKTQELYVIVFLARYLDLFWNFLSLYNWVWQAFYLNTGAFTKFSSTNCCNPVMLIPPVVYLALRS